MAGAASWDIYRNKQKIDLVNAETDFEIASVPNQTHKSYRATAAAIAIVAVMYLYKKKAA